MWKTCFTLLIKFEKMVENKILPKQLYWYMGDFSLFFAFFPEVKWRWWGNGGSCGCGRGDGWKGVWQIIVLLCHLKVYPVGKLRWVWSSIAFKAIKNRLDTRAACSHVFCIMFWLQNSCFDCLYTCFRSCSHITSAKIRGSWNPRPLLYYNFFT